MVIARNKPQHVCPAYRCKHAKAKKKGFCTRHAHVNQKQNNLVGYTYTLLKGNAKRRKKVFTLTLAEFREFCEETGYLLTKGRTKRKMSIDRIDNTLGYEKGNLRLLSVSANASKSDDCPF